MMFSRDKSGRLLLVVVMVMVMTNVILVSSDVFTSMTRIKDMVVNERNILNNINEALTEYPDVKGEFLSFYRQRVRDIERRNVSKELERIAHPNGAYSIIQEFATDYEHVRQKIAEARGDLANWYMTHIADQEDVVGARNSLLLLQEVYNLTSSDMAGGVYMEKSGPALNSTDTFLVGQAAFAEGKYRQSAEWLETTLKLLMTEESVSKEFGYDDSMTSFGKVGTNRQPVRHQIDMAQVLGLLGRVLLRIGEVHRASRLFQEANVLGPNHGDVIVLGQELNHVTATDEGKRSEEDEAFHRLCAQHSKLTGKFTDGRLRCRTRALFLPYYRYNEEIVSNTPYVSLFYNVVSDQEAEDVKQLSKERLYRGGVVGSKGNTLTRIRTSNIGFIEDQDSNVVRSVSQRIAQLTGLETALNPAGFYTKKQSAAEPLQVVNYGIGGYYSVHMDPYEHLNKDTKPVMLYSGNRLATFLVYLTDVERGGSTAFPLADLVVPPSKGNAVFWYSFTPDGQLDLLTRHAGCPVMVGEKWVMNKWLLTFGQTFRRRCGLRKDATQLDIDQDMRRGYKPTRASRRTKRAV